MEIRPDPEDRPHHLRQEPRSRLHAVAIGGLLAAVASGGIYWWYVRDPGSPAQARPPEVAATPAQKPQPSAAIRFPVPGADAGMSLPTLEMSDALARASIAGLIGSQAFADLVAPNGIVRRFVATVDNLPREVAPRRMFPVYSVPGALGVTGRGEGLAIAPANAARYAIHLRALESVDAAALVKTYVRLYPLFQRAYEELGFPGRHFNDRLIEAIDDLLASPEAVPPIRLLQPKVLYEYADTDLETRSAGQKILVRMGEDNAARVKEKLREIRRQLTAVSQPKT